MFFFLNKYIAEKIKSFDGEREFIFFYPRVKVLTLKYSSLCQRLIQVYSGRGRVNYCLLGILFGSTLNVRKLTQKKSRIVIEYLSNFLQLYERIIRNNIVYSGILFAEYVLFQI